MLVLSLGVNGAQQYALRSTPGHLLRWQHWVTLTSIMQTPDAIWNGVDVLCHNLERVGNRAGIHYRRSLEKGPRQLPHIHAALRGHPFNLHVQPAHESFGPTVIARARL